MIEKYRPSNGTEGDIFMSKWCANCIEDTELSPCEIIFRTLTYNEDDEEYPDKWTYNDAGIPICTAFAAKDTPYRCSDTKDMFG